MNLADLRLHPSHESDLHWLFAEATGAMGLRSSLGAQLERMRLGLGSRSAGFESHPSDDSRIDAVDRAHRLEHRLAQLPREHRRTLAAAYGSRVTTGLEAAWSWLATPSLPVALMLLTAQRLTITRERLRGWRATSTPEQRAKATAGVAKLRCEAMVALAQAARAYMAARRG